MRKNESTNTIFRSQGTTHQAAPTSPTTQRAREAPARIAGISGAVRQALNKVVGDYVLPRAAEADVRYVIDCFELRMKGQLNNYNFMIRSLKSLSNNAIRWLSALSACVHLLNESNSDIVRDILECDLIEGRSRSLELLEDAGTLSLAHAQDSSYAVMSEVLGKKISDSFIIFMTQLVCVHPTHIKKCLEALVTRFLPVCDEHGTIVTDIVVQDKILECVSLLVTVVPTGSSLLFPIIEETYPHMKIDSLSHGFFVRNLLALISHIPPIEKRAISLIIEKMIQMDVEVKTEAEAEAENDGETGEDAGVFEFDAEIGVSGLIATPDQTAIPLQSRQSDSEKIAAKLDDLMEIMMAHFSNIQAHEGTDRSEEILSALIESFNNTMIRTQKSKYVQFLIFYVCSFNPPFAEAFLAHLLEILRANESTRAIRQTCAAYMGSFIARSKFLTPDTIRNCLEHLAYFAYEYTCANAARFRLTDIERHGVLYYVCQSILYIFCFRHDEILDELDEPKEYFNLLNIRGVIESSFNPLRVCLSSVVNEFAKICATRQLMDCAPIIQRNLSVILPSRQSWGGQYQLDPFFPFDPYTLPKSRRFITPLYINWDEQEHESQDEFLSQKSDSEQIGSLQSYQASLDNSISGLEMMSFE